MLASESNVWHKRDSAYVPLKGIDKVFSTDLFLLDFGQNYVDQMLNSAVGEKKAVLGSGDVSNISFSEAGLRSSLKYCSFRIPYTVGDYNS